MIIFLFVFAVICVYLIMEDRVNDQREFTERIIETHIEAFNLGYQTRNREPAFDLDENEVFSVEPSEEEVEPEIYQERWSD